MSTKLEAMVGYLAGRSGDPQLLDELSDPSSEASRFLEATRDRSRALLDPSPVEPLAIRSNPWRKIAVAVLATALLVALGVAIAMIAIRVQSLKTSLDRHEAGSLAILRRLESSVVLLAAPKPPDPAFERVEAALGRLEDRLERLEKAPGPKSSTDPSIVEVREGLNAVRRELTAVEKVSSRQTEELRASIHEVERLLRLMINRGEPSPPAEPSTPNFPKTRPSGGR